MDESHIISTILADWLYLGSIDAAVDRALLTRVGITHILSIGSELPIKYLNIKYMRVNICDDPTEPLYPHFDSVVDFINEARTDNKHNKVLLHCHAGISRSPAFTIAYLMTCPSPTTQFTQGRLTYEQALAHVRAARPIIDPNFGFTVQLMAYDLKLAAITAKRPQEFLLAVCEAATYHSIPYSYTLILRLADTAEELLCNGYFDNCRELSCYARSGWQILMDTVGYREKLRNLQPTVNNIPVELPPLDTPPAYIPETHSWWANARFETI